MSVIQSFDEFAGVIVERQTTKGDTIYVREISTEEAEDLFDIFGADGVTPDKAKAKGMRARIIAACVCKQDGSPLGTPDDTRKIPAHKAMELQRIAMEVNGFTKDALEVAAKNS